MDKRPRPSCMGLIRGNCIEKRAGLSSALLVLALAGCHTAADSVAAGSPQAVRTVGHTASAPAGKGAGPADLIGPTWYLESWTDARSHRQLPGTERPPTLVFDSQTAAHTDDPTNTTTWTLRLSGDAIAGTEGPTTLVAEDQPTQAAYAATAAVLAGRASWRLDGDDLVITGPGRRSLSYTKDPARGLRFGTMDVGVEARGYQPYWISGKVSVRGPDGSVVTRQVGEQGARLLRLKPGRYTVSAVVKAGNCKPTAVDVRGGAAVRPVIACLLDDRQPPGQYTAILVHLVVTGAGGTAGTQSNPGIGQVVVRRIDGTLFWHGKVTPWDGHPIFATPGRYSVSAVIAGGRCGGARTTVVLHHISTVTLDCK